MKPHLLSLALSLLILSTAVLDTHGGLEMKNTFKIESWDESPYLEFDNGAKHSRAKLLKKYSGELKGTGQLVYLMAYNTSGAAYFTGIEHFEGHLNGKAGTLSITHEGTFSNGSVESTFRIIEGSQSAELIGLTGDGQYKTGHSMTVDFIFTYSYDQ